MEREREIENSGVVLVERWHVYVGIIGFLLTIVTLLYTAANSRGATDSAVSVKIEALQAQVMALQNQALSKDAADSKFLDIQHQLDGIQQQLTSQQRMLESMYGNKRQ